MKERIITKQLISNFKTYLQNEEKSMNINLFIKAKEGIEN